MQVASNATARLGGDPKVGASRVKDNLESLGGSTDGNFRKVYSLGLVNPRSLLGDGRAVHIDLHWAFMKLVTGTG